MSISWLLWLFQWSFTLSKSSWRSFEKQNHPSIHWFAGDEQCLWDFTPASSSWSLVQNYRTIRRIGILVTIPMIFHFVQVILKKLWKTEPQALHMNSVSHTKQSIINHVLEKAYPPVWSISPEKGPPSFNSLICRWWAVPMRLHTYQFILIIGTKHALHRNGNTIFWATISHQEQRATTQFFYLF